MYLFLLVYLIASVAMDRIKRAWTYIAIEEFDGRRRAATLAAYEAILEKACARASCAVPCTVSIEEMDHAMEDPMRDVLQSATPPVLNVHMSSRELSVLCRVAVTSRDLALLTMRVNGRRCRGETELVLQGVHGETMDTMTLTKHLTTPVRQVHVGPKSISMNVALRLLDVLCPLLYASRDDDMFDMDTSDSGGPSFITQSLESEESEESASFSESEESDATSRTSTVTYDSDLH